MIERIKEFLKQNNMEWTGDIITYKDDDFRAATDKDFRLKDIYNLLISFPDGNMCASIEIDIVGFYIVGELKGIYIENYAGNNEENQKFFEQRDLSKEWIDFQLKNYSLVYAAALRKYCEKNKQLVETRYEEKERMLKSRLESLQRDKENSLKEYEELEALIETTEKTL